MQKIRVQLYTTAGCHLCDQAFEMIRYLLLQEPAFGKPFDLELVEIAEDTILLEKYGLRIPVLKREENELCWPFELECLQEWLTKK